MGRWRSIICESVIGNWPWRPAAAAAWPPCLKASCSQVPGVSPRESWCLGSFLMDTAGCRSSHQLMKPASQLQYGIRLMSHVSHVSRCSHSAQLSRDESAAAMQNINMVTKGHRVKQLLVVESLT